MVETESQRWQWLLFENPLPLSLAFAAGAAILFWHGMRRQDRKAQRIAPWLLVPAVGVWCIAVLVTTPREIVRNRARELVGLTAPLNSAGLHDYFDQAAVLVRPDNSLWIAGGRNSGGELDAERLAFNIRFWQIRSHWIKSIDVELLKSHRATTLLRIRTTLSGEWGDQPVHTDWLLTWVQGKDGTWRVEKAQWLKLNGKPPVDIVLR